MEFPFSPVKTIKEKNAFKDIRDVDEYPYCAVYTSGYVKSCFLIYEWDKVKNYKTFVSVFNKMDWDLLAEDTYFKILKKNLTDALENVIELDQNIDPIEVPSIVLAGEIPSQPLSKSVFKLDVYQKEVYSNGTIYEKRGRVYFNNGKFIFLTISMGDSDNDSDSD